MTPSAASRAIAWRTVPGLTRCRSIRLRTDGIRAPGASRRASTSSACSTEATLLLSFMRSDSSVTLANGEAFPGADLLLDAAARGIRYRAFLPTRRVAPTAEALAQLDQFDGDLPRLGRDPHAIIGQLDSLGSPATVGMAG